MICQPEKAPEKLSITLALTSNRGSERNKIIAYSIYREEFVGRPENIDFFSLKFDLRFGQNKKLKEIVMLRGVNPFWRKKGICTRVSLNFLEKIYQNYSADRPQLKFNACHIATVKFCYPLNRFYHRETDLHLRDIDPSESDFKLIDIVQSNDEDFSDFSYDRRLDSASCLHRSIDLKKFIDQYKLRNLFSELLV